jgi:arylsulfatase A-like enzyme
MPNIRAIDKLSLPVLIFACLHFATPHTPSLTRAAESCTHSPMNIVLILVDDLGWTDLGCFGSPTYQTPHIDRLASTGVRFTEAYAPACSCSPSRAGIMTGKYPGRLGMTAIVEKHRGDNAPDDAPLLPATTRPFLPDAEITIAEVLKSAGYATCLVGKWHLGDWKHDPKQHGFDVAIAPPHAGAPKSYFWPRWDGNPRLPGRFEGEYLTDRLAEEACGFVEDHGPAPFFVYLSFHSVHVPIEAKSAKVAKYAAILRAHEQDAPQHDNAHYAAMVESLDEAVGRVLAALQKLNLEHDTLVVFFSDNGGLVHRSHRGEHTPATSNAPLRSGKGFLYEGGIRVPLIIRWPGVAKSGGVCHAPVHGCDLFPTICQAAGIAVDTLSHRDQLDGRDLQPLLRDPHQKLPQRTLFWHYPHFSTMGGRPSAAMRQGKWKLIEHLETGVRELYDLRDDIGETQNLAKLHPDKAEQLQRSLADWRMRMNALMPSQPNPNYQGVEHASESQ